MKTKRAIRFSFVMLIVFVLIGGMINTSRLFSVDDIGKSWCFGYAISKYDDIEKYDVLDIHMVEDEKLFVGYHGDSRSGFIPTEHVNIFYCT